MQDCRVVLDTLSRGEKRFDVEYRAVFLGYSLGIEQYLQRGCLGHTAGGRRRKGRGRRGGRGREVDGDRLDGF